ncbi:MAG TPA: hypothetical protein PK655_00270 [archaeon]|nr:hypothetical protein [archaeon]HPV65878.1 hypothetical protein [archaeon]
MEHKLCLLNSSYEKDRARVVLYFGRDPLNNNYELIHKATYYPYFIVELEKELVSQLLSDFKKDISLKSLDKKTKIIARDFELLSKCSKILQQATGKNIILIEPERQFLIRNNWSYYDSFCVFKRNIRKINNENHIHFAIKNYTKNLNYSEKIRLIEPLTKKLILSNILRLKPETNIKNDQILNILFENEFFNKELILTNTNNFYYQTKEKFIKDHINLDFSNILPHLLTKNFNNVGFETINCACCKPLSTLQENVMPSSLVEVEFKKSGFYFISCDDYWAREYHNNHELKENRENYKKQNGLFKMVVGPFSKGQKEKILLADALRLLKDKDLTILENQTNLVWSCKKQESFVSKIINTLFERQNVIEQSINISTLGSYSVGNFENSKALETNPLFLQYLTEYSLINSLIEEIPKFMQNKNTKFYSSTIDNILRNIKYNTLERVTENDETLIISKTGNFQIKNKTLLSKINSSFQEMGLPIPRLIVN